MLHAPSAIFSLSFLQYSTLGLTSVLYKFMNGLVSIVPEAYMSTQRESFEGQNGGPPSEARRASGGGCGDPPPGIFEKPVLQMVQSEVFLSYMPCFACAGANVNEINAKILLRK